MRFSGFLQVVKALWEYIKGNELQAPSNKRKIIVDDKLATLFTKPLGEQHAQCAQCILSFRVF